MSKFKVGDRVRRIQRDNHACGYSFCVGETGVVTAIATWPTVKADASGFHDECDPDYLELVEEESELERLVRVANEGYRADDKLRREYAGSCEVRQRGMEWCSMRYSVGDEYQVRIKPKAPAFEPFTTSRGWSVSYENDKIRIGCHVFSVGELLRCLPGFVAGSRHTTVFLDNGQATPSRHGIVYQCFDRISYEETLPWSDAEELLKRLKAAFPEGKQ